MNIDIGADGKVLFSAPQQRWNAGRQSEDKGVLETANFAGQRLMVVSDDAGAFDLHYLGFIASGFKTMAAAKQAAPEFARRVLNRMHDMIAS